MTSNIYKRLQKRFGIALTDTQFIMLATAQPDNPLTEEDALKFDKRFSWDDVIISGLIHLKPEIANQYKPIFTAREIAHLYSFGITPDRIASDVDKERVRLVQKISRINGINFFYSKFKYIAAGASAIVVLKEQDGKKEAWKFCEYAEKEYRILRKVEKANKNLCNVVKTTGPVQYKIAMPVEYVDGPTLENFLNEYTLKPKKAFKYIIDLLNGLEEFGNAGLIYRDVHGRNVIINSADDRALFVDAGLSSSNGNIINEGNRAYGGNNDLVSLGQLSYTMIAGHNLFKEGTGNTLETSVKDQIKQSREEIYKDKKKLQSMLVNVQREFPEKIGYGIAKLLDDDLWTQPSVDKIKSLKKVFNDLYKSL